MEVVNGQSSQDVTLSFVIPASANKVELEVGKPGVQETAGIPIALGVPNPNSLQVIKGPWSLADEQGNAHQEYDFSLSADWDRVLFLPHG